MAVSESNSIWAHVHFHASQEIHVPEMWQWPASSSVIKHCALASEAGKRFDL